jgi:hypothetical protein
MRRRAPFLILMGTVALTVGFPAAAEAAEADGCSGSVTTLDESGAVIGTMSAPGAGGTRSDPLPIDMAGSVDWEGSTDTVITDASWWLTVGGIRVGGGPAENADGETSKSGTQDLPDLLGSVSWLLSGSMAIPVAGEFSGEGGTCSGNAWITGTGSATSAPLLYVGAGLGLVGLLMGVGVFVGTKAAAVGAVAAGGAA